jgi:hypothetical protein
VGFKATAGFKATDKSGGNTAIAAIKNLGANLVNAVSGNAAASPDSLPVSQSPLAAAANPKPVAPPKVIIGPNGQRIVQRPMTQAEVMQVSGPELGCLSAPSLHHSSKAFPPISVSALCPLQSLFHSLVLNLCMTTYSCQLLVYPN